MARVLLMSGLLVSDLVLPVAADPPPAIAGLVQKLTAACREHNLGAIKACYDTDGATPEEIDLALSIWQEYLNQGGDVTQWKFNKITYRSLDEIQGDRTMNLNFLASLGRHRMGEHFYDENLAPVGFITSSFEAGKGSSVGNMMPVGITSGGIAKLSLTHRVD